MNNRLFLLLFLLFIANQIFAQHQEKAPGAKQDNLPLWVQMMYAENPDPESVKVAYDAYYETHDFTKNGHTQYYKHWLRNLSRDRNGVFSGSTSWKNAKIEEATYLQKTKDLALQRGPNSAWECVGPYDFDKDAAERSYAPGAAHVYTVEKAPSNSNIVYCGTATAGVFKSTDNGLTWNLMTRDYLINGVRAMEIDPNNANIVIFESGGSLYKTTDGGTTWNVIGDAVFQNSSHSANDIVAYPNSSNTYFLCADDGLYRTDDAGDNWTKIFGGEWQELEFQPNNPTQIYAVKQVNNYTEFYKSTDGGTTWNIKPTGWPGLNGSSATTFDALSKGNAGTDYVTFANDPEPGQPAMRDFSIELRVKTTGWTSDPAIFSNKNWASGFNRGFVIAGNTNGSTWKFNIGDGSSRIDLNGGTINDGVWHQLTVTYDFDGTKSVYQDGILINTTTDAISDDVINTIYDLAIGQDGTFNYNAGIGMEIADVRIWNTILDAATIESWKCKTLDNTHPNYANLVNHWKLDEGAGTTVNDAIGGNTGTLTGSNSWSTSNNMTCVNVDLEAGEEQGRVEIAVTPANPNIVYALATGVVNGGSGLFGIYKSTDAGETWTFNCCGPQPGGPAVAGSNINMMGWDDQGGDNGGQYYYDLGLNVSPTNADRVHVGGVNHWVSDDGGVTFTCPAKWSHPGKAMYVHADIHDIRYFGNELWIACDGGLFYSTNEGATIDRRMVGIEGTDFWGFGASFNDGEVMVGGTYHNGTLLKNNSVYLNDWLSTRGGDNIRGFVNEMNNQTVYDDGGKRILSTDRNTDFQEYGYSMNPNASYIIGQSSNIEFGATSPNISYSGVGTAIWKTEDDGVNFTQIYDFGSGNTVGEIRAAWSDEMVLYAATFGSSDRVWASNDGGVSWSDVTPAGNSVPYSITVSATDANVVWAAKTPSYTWQGAHDGNKIFKSTDGGASWSNISGSALNGEHITNIMHQKGTNGGVYAATRRAVYYKNDSMSDFVLFNNNLPAATFSTRLIGNYGAGKLYNGTNRSVYRVDFYEPSQPVAQIAAKDFTVLCSGDDVQFYDHSVALDGASYNWSFPGATPSSSNLKNPIVKYNDLGMYDVTLTITDANGTSSQTLTNVISVENNCNPETVPGMALSLNNTSDYATLDAPNFSTNNFTVSAWIKRDGDQNDWAGLIFSRPSSGASGLNFGTNNELRYHWEGSGSYNWNSGHVVPDNEWTHVCLVVTPDDATIYMNGEPSVRTLSHSVHNFDAIVYLGRDPNSSARTFKGLMDEVTIYNRALSQQEVRELRHLTRIAGDANFQKYYQFNEPSGDVFNRVGGGAHAVLQGNASRTTSTAPVGGGESFTLNCTTGGVKNFTNTDLSLEFSATGTYPNGDLVVSRLDLNPDQLPNNFPESPSYWVINNYGTNANFSELGNIVFENIGNVPNNATASEYKLYKRNDNDDGATWGNSIDFADALTTGNEGSATFSTDNGITNFSQFIVMRQAAVLPIELLQFSVVLNKNQTVDIHWATATEIDNDYFIIERSRDGLTFEAIEKVASQGNANEKQTYQTADENPHRGMSYYRLKQVDFNGKFTYSDVRSITINALQNPIVVYPNPVGIQQKLHIESDYQEDLEVVIFGTDGKQLLTEKIEQGSGAISLNGLSAGAYYYRILGNGFVRNGVVFVE